MAWLTTITIPLVAALLWHYTISIARARFPVGLRDRTILLLIAHPDDEAMFFAPTLLALTAPALGNRVKILCLSSGDADGLGETRKRELVKSGMLLGVQREEDIAVIESPEFPDSMTTTWPPEAIAHTLATSVLSRAADAPQSSIQVLITFDAHGVSSHPNHVSLHAGARHYLSTLASPIDLYTLTSLPLWRKYLGIFDAPLSTALMTLRLRRHAGEALPSALLFVSGPRAMRRAQEAMWKAHRSQMRWFRWAWILLSRYMVVNDLVLEEIR